MAASTADRNLLFGVLALQMDFVSKDQLVAGMHAWVLEKTKPLAQILVDQGALSASHRDLLQPLVEAHIQQHQDDPAQSLAALGSVTSIHDALDQVHDFDVQASLGRLTEARSDRMAMSDDTLTYVCRPTATGGRFRVLRLHDRGGLGEVFVARDEEVHREVALKQIKPECADDTRGRDRFLIEAKITGGLEHPGIVPVYGLGKYDDGRPYYAMRFIRGDSLRTVIDRFHADEEDRRDPGKRSLALRELLGRFLDVCDAIAYAHSRGVLHRDLKPGNVMLGEFGETLVVDWGMAKAVGRKLDAALATGETILAPESDAQPTEMGERIGTPAYMPPEQAAGRLDELGPASDVYSLGATLYALLTGQAPFTDEAGPTLYQKIERGEFAPPWRLQPWIDPALEAVCLKAMALKPADRYPSPRALAADLQKWLADEPVSAWRELWPRRFRRWARRNRTLVTSASVALPLVAAGLLFATYQAGLRAREHQTAAEGRVDALCVAEVRAVPGIIQELGKDRALVRDRLTALADGTAPGRVAAQLALLPDEPRRAEALAERMLDEEVPPDELVVVREALAKAGRLGEQSARFQAVLKDQAETLTDAQLRALGGLVGSGGDRWTKAAGPLVAKLVGENPLRLGAWREVFQPVSTVLLEPLRAIYANRAEPEARDRAFTLLFEFATQADNPKRPEELAALLVEADPHRLNRILARLTEPNDRARVIADLAPRLEPIARFDDALAERQGRVALALARLGQVERVWPLFAHRDDPGVRTELIHEFGRYSIDPKRVIARLKEEQSVSARRALILTLGEYPIGRGGTVGLSTSAGEGPSTTLVDKSSVAPSQNPTLVALLLNWYRTDPDPGIHGAVDWLLRQMWGRGNDLAAIDRELASPELPAVRDWYVNGQGQTFTIIRGPVEFTMGSAPESDPDRRFDEVAHRRRIPRSFALANREITVAEWGRFLDEKKDGAVDLRGIPQFQQQIPSLDCAIGAVTWYEAARYCNWLSELEGIPREQWCYSEEIKEGMKLAEGFLERTGYRLPTEGEWEYACRSGAVSSRPYGRSEARLPSYAWSLTNSGRTMHPVGRLKPNDLGLFDVLGNAYEWLNDPYVAYKPAEGGGPFVDAEFSDQVDRVLRGGSFYDAPTWARAADRYGDRPTDRSPYDGLRPARTYY
jgi:formylglycine-generating enzyme required for sulfatase activity/tRNA A-37 threonylcarbamoyl transferase component Bud32